MGKEMNMRAETMTRELAHRSTSGIDVSLLWDPVDDRLTVRVEDAQTDDCFILDARNDNALEVFYHPYVYASDYSAGAAATRAA
jgi:hypothetical protein